MNPAPHLFRASVAIASALCVVAAETPSPTLIQLKVVEGDRAVYAAGSRATKGIAILVSDQNGNPLEDAAVSFELPGDGPGGRFASGTSQETVKTRADGVASIWGMQWNKAPGPFEIRVTAALGQARAGMIVKQRLEAAKATPAAPQAGGEGMFRASHHILPNKWVLIGIAVGGAAGYYGFHVATAKPPAPTVTATPLSIGNPSIYVGHP